MLIEMTCLSTDTLGNFNKPTNQTSFTPAAEIRDMYDHFAWTLNAPF